MEVKILEEKKDRVKVEIGGEGHSFCNALRKELWNDKHVKVAGYTIEHSLEGKPVITIETDGEESPKTALKKAAERLEKNASEFKKKFKSIRF